MLDTNRISLTLKAMFMVRLMSISSFFFLFNPVEFHSAGKLVKPISPIIINAEFTSLAFTLEPVDMRDSMSAQGRAIDECWRPAVESARSGRRPHRCQPTTCPAEQLGCPDGLSHMFVFY